MTTPVSRPTASHEATASHEPKPTTPREGFLDTIRAIATIRVVFWHAFGSPILSFVVASMPTMFFVAGSLLGASLDRRDSCTVLGDRLKRLLIPFWLFGAFVISVMAISRVVTGRADTALSPTKLLGWIVPLVDPKGSVWEAGWLSQPMWYVRAFLWLLLAAPMLRSALRRFGNAVFAPSIVVVIATEFFIRHPHSTPPGFATWRWYTGDFALYSVFLLLGFRHREGAFRSLSTSARIEWGFIAGICAAVWCVTQPLIGNVVNNSYPAHFLVGATWLCIFLALENVLAKGPTTPILGPVIRWLTQRSLTVYLWHTTTIVCADYILNRFAPHATRLLVIPIVVTLILLFAAIFGWAEDVSAGRKARLWPLPLPFVLPSPRTFAHRAVHVVRTLTIWSNDVHRLVGAGGDQREKGAEQQSRAKLVSAPKPKRSPLLTGFFGFGTAMALIAVAPLTTTSRLQGAPTTDLSGRTKTSVTNRRPPAPSARPDTAVFATPGPITTPGPTKQKTESAAATQNPESTADQKTESATATQNPESTADQKTESAAATQNPESTADQKTENATATQDTASTADQKPTTRSAKSTTHKANAPTEIQQGDGTVQPGSSAPEAALAGGKVRTPANTSAQIAARTPLASPVVTQVAKPEAGPVKPKATPTQSPIRLGSTPRWTAMPPATASKLQATLEKWMKEINVSGVTIALGRPDGTLWNAGSGTLGPNDQMDVTSITKTFTSALALSLADEGKISLDAPIPTLRAVPTFPKGTGITPRQLLQHASGLSTYQDTPEYLANPSISLTPAQAVSLAAKQKLLWPPGTNSGYSSSGYLTLGLLSEQAGGDSYKAQLEKRFFEPFGLTNTIVDETPIEGWIGFSTGGVRSTTADLVTWGAALYRDRTVVSQQASAEIVNVNNDWSVGLGAWPVCPCSLDSAGRKVFTSIGHNGGSGSLEYSPADHVVIAAFLSEPIFNSRITQQDLYELFARLRTASAL